VATGAITVLSGATLGGTGTVGGDVTIASGGKLEFDIATAPGSHNSLDIVTGKGFTFSGTSTLTITSTGGTVSGAGQVYTLITGGNNITGSAPGTVNLPAGWTLVSLVVSGNSLVLTVDIA
jgi:fibronectin-binding autotransporter adhesin